MASGLVKRVGSLRENSSFIWLSFSGAGQSDVRQADAYSADCMQVPFPSDAIPWR
jgi:hypothetical protein